VCVLVVSVEVTVWLFRRLLPTLARVFLIGVDASPRPAGLTKLLISIALLTIAFYILVVMFKLAWRTWKTATAPSD
jgi:hypothetical protein